MAIDWIIKGSTITNSDGTIAQGNDQRAPVYHLIQGDYYQRQIYYGSTLVWTERIGDYQTGTLPTGVASLTCTRTSKDPAIAAGTITDGDYLYHNDTLKFTATAKPYWNVSITNPTITVTQSASDKVSSVAISREHTITGVTKSGVEATGQMYTAKGGSNGMIEFNEVGDSIAFNYYDGTGTTQTYSYTYSSSTAAPQLLFSKSCWRGGTATFTSTPKSSYYSGITRTISIGAQAQGSTYYLPADVFTRKMRNIYFYYANADYTVTYTNASGTSVSTTLSPASGDYSQISAFCGATVTWSAAKKFGYTVSPSSGTVAVSTSTSAVSVQPTYGTATKSWYSYPEGVPGSFSWTSSEWGSTSQSNTKTLKNYGYLGVRLTQHVRISGTFKANSTQVSFSNVVLTKGGNTLVATVNYGSSLSKRTYNLYVTWTTDSHAHYNRINAYVTCTSTRKSKVALVVNISTVQVYCYPSSEVLEAPASVSIRTNDIYVKNNNPVTVYPVFKGTFVFGSGDELSSSSYTMGYGDEYTISANNTGYLGAMEIVGASEDESVNTLSEAYIGFICDDALNVSGYGPMEF